MGTETEYGLIDLSGTVTDAADLSALVVHACASVTTSLGSAQWDYGDEDPLADARGWHLSRATASKGGQTNAPHLQGAPRDWVNYVLGNGARCYVDHAHPEYSSPEVTNPHDAVVWDRAGDTLMSAALRWLADFRGLDAVALYKNNVDGKGSTYGAHENYLLDRRVSFDLVTDHLVAFLVTRQVFAGAGRVGLGTSGDDSGFQISQRADYLERSVGLETTCRRSIVNTRDEPHARAERYRRLHLICGDANAVEPSAFLKLGTTALVMQALNACASGCAHPDLPRLADPVKALRTVSRDLDVSVQLPLADTGTMKAVDIQRHYLEWTETTVAGAVPWGCGVIRRWRDVLERLGRDAMSCRHDVEWVAKLALLNAIRDRENAGWDSPKLALVDFQWSDLRRGKGLARKLETANEITRVTGDSEVAAAMTNPPSDTRAFFRGRMISQYPDSIAYVNWDSLTVDTGTDTQLIRLPLPEPLRGTEKLVGPILDDAPPLETLIRELAGDDPPSQ